MSATCIFCEIASGRLPAAIVFECERFVAFLDHRPLFPGHCILIPREHYVTLPDLPERDMGPLFTLASRLCLGLSVFDNILIGMHARRTTGLVDSVFRRARFLREMSGAVERAGHLLALFSRDLPARGFEPVGQLPQIDRRRVEICRALATEPKLLLLDEPSAGMSPEETAELMRDLQIVREEMPGLSVVIIEHDMFVIEGVSGRVVAFNYGRKIAEGSFAAVAAHEEVREAYLGRERARA